MVVVSVQARMGSTRLPGKVLLSLAGKRVLEWVFERCTEANSVASIVFAVGDRPENDAITEWCRRDEYSYVVGPEDDLLERHLKVARETESDFIVRVTGDCPFVPPEEIDRLVGEYREGEVDYVTNVTDEMPVGTGVDVITTSVLNQLSDQGETHPVKTLRENPDDWNVEFTGNPEWKMYSDAHIAVDTPKDYWTLTDAVEAVGPDPHEVVEWVSTQK